MEEINLRIRGKDRNISIFLGYQIVENLPTILKRYGINNCFVLSNNTIWQLWGNSFLSVLKDIKHTLHLIPDGERYKNIKTVSEIYEHLSISGATRNTAFIAIGGGVVGDLGGFVASTYHRGMPLVHVPTTLLAQVDSSIGGKTGYNLKTGKNIVGTFYQPIFVFVDTILLTTLSEKEFIAGMAEVIKSALIKDALFFDYLEKNREKILRRDKKALNYVVKHAEKIKINVVERDERESGERAILNFGHTIGHAIERYKNWKILHGEAVAIGMCYAAALSLKKGYISEETYNRILNLIKNYGLPISIRISFNKLENLIYYDKKRRERDVEWVLLKGIGQAVWGEKVNNL